MNGTTFPSNPCYLPIYENPASKYSFNRYTKVWNNFINYPNHHKTFNSERIREWNGTLINDVIVFDTEQDKMWFILRWS